MCNKYSRLARQKEKEKKEVQLTKDNADFQEAWHLLHDFLSPRSRVQQILQPAHQNGIRKVLFLCSVMVADFQEAWHMLHDGRLVA